MRRTNLLAAILVAGISGMFMFASTARADTIFHYTFGYSTQGVTLTSDGSGGFTAALGSGTSTYTLSNPTTGTYAYNSVNSEIGEGNEFSAYTITTSGLLSFAANNGSGIFSTSGTSTLQIVDQGESGEWPLVTINWQYMKDGSNLPTLVGSTTINGVAYIVDLQLSSIGTGITLGGWAAGNTGSVTANSISSGQLDLTPEPMSMLLMMFGFAMIGLVAIRRRPAAIDRLA